MNSIEQAIAKLDRHLSDIPFDFAFLGGSILSLLITDHTVDSIRVTKDIDIMVDVRSRKAFHEAEELLVKHGFKHDMRDDAPICRWVYDGITVDVLPAREDVLGWNSKWFEQALGAAEEVECAGRTVKMVSAPYFVALKLEAFEDRGNSDFLYSTDFEDVICLFNGRANIAAEIAANETLAKPLAQKFKKYLKSPEMEDAIDGFVQTEINPETRKQSILAIMHNIANLA